MSMAEPMLGTPGPLDLAVPGSSHRSLFRAGQPVLDPPPEGVNPGDQNPETPGVNLLLESGYLAAELMQIHGPILEFFRCQNVRLRDGFQCPVRLVGKLTDLAANFGRV